MRLCRYIMEKVLNLWIKMLNVWRYVYRQHAEKIKNRMNGILSDVQHLLKNGQKLDLFAAHYGQHFKYTMSHMDLCKCILFKVVK